MDGNCTPPGAGVSDRAEQLPRMSHAHFEIVALLPPRVLSRGDWNGRGWFTAVGKRHKAAELPRRHLAIVIPELGVEDIEHAGLPGNEVFEDQRQAGTQGDELPNPAVDIDIAVAHVDPSH